LTDGGSTTRMRSKNCRHKVGVGKTGCQEEHRELKRSRVMERKRRGSLVRRVGQKKHTKTTKATGRTNTRESGKEKPKVAFPVSYSLKGQES